MTSADALDKSVLVAYGSKRGATAEIAEAIAEELRSQGLHVDCLPADQTPRALAHYDAAVLGSAVYVKSWRPEARHFLRAHARDLESMPFWIFSSGPVGDKELDPTWSEPKRTLRRAKDLGSIDHVVFGGRVPADPHGFIEKAMARNTPDESADLRDWDAIRNWARSIAEHLGRSTTAAGAVEAR